MKRRYEVRAVFTDKDYGEEPLSVKRFWTLTTALVFYDEYEEKRKAKNVDRWHWVVFDTKTQRVIA